MKPSVNGWPTLCLSDVADIASGVAKGRRLQGEIVTVPYLRVANVQAGHLDLSEIKEIVVLASEVDKYRLLPGDILMTEGGDRDKLGRGTVWRGEIDPCIHQNHVFRVRPAADRLLPEFLNYYMQTPAARSYFLRCAKQTTGIASVNRTQLSGLPVPLPTIREQKRIAAILDKADGIRRKRYEALEALSRLETSLFQARFSGYFNGDESAYVPVSTFVERFEGGVNMATPDSPTPETKYYILKVSAVTWGEYDPSEAKPLPSDYEPPMEHFVRQGDLLISRANTTELVGATAYVEESPPDRVLPDKLWRFIWRNREGVEPLFVHALLKHPRVRFEMGRRATGTSGSMKNISMEKVLSMRVPFPPIEEQRGFAKQLEQTRRIRDRLRGHTDESEDLFASLVHRAFRGELS